MVVAGDGGSVRRYYKDFLSGMDRKGRVWIEQEKKRTEENSTYLWRFWMLKAIQMRK